ERIALKGLEPAAIGELVAESAAPRDIHEPLSAAIASVTNGNPFFARELLHHLAEEDRFGADGHDHAINFVAQMGIPNSLRDVIRRRVNRLSDDARRLLTIASAWGGPFHLGVAAQVAGLDDVAALDALDEALSAQLVQPTGSAERYDFTHALIRETLHAE